MRYMHYYLHFPQRIQAAGIAEVSLEIPHMQRAFNWSIAFQNQYVPDFWNAAKDLLMNYGFWHVFIDWGRKSLLILQDLEYTEDEAWLRSDLGWLAMEQNQFPAAHHLFLTALDEFQQSENLDGICTLERYLGVLKYRMGDLTQADEHVSKSLCIANMEKFEGKVALALDLKGSIARKRQQYDLARRFYRESIERLANLEKDSNMILVKRNLARLECQEGYFSKAKSLYLEILKECERLHRMDALYGCQVCLAEVEIELGYLENAHLLLTLAREGFIQLGMHHDLELVGKILQKLSSTASTARRK